MAQDSINFCISSVGRNRFLQPATGLFGGDDLSLGTYTSVDDHYHRSEAYSRTLTVWRDRTNANLYQRYPESCWFAIGTARVLTLPDPTTGTMTLAWTLVDTLWNTVRIPGQTMTFVVDGELIHGTVLSTSTATVAAVRVDPTTAGSLRLAADYDYMLRYRPPSAVWRGPIVRASANSVLVQGVLNAVPTGNTALVYLGGRAAHPTRMCAIPSPTVARTNIYAIVDARIATSGGTGGTTTTTTTTTVALLSTPTVMRAEAWAQRTEYFAVGTLFFDAPTVVTGYTYMWPYPSDQNGDTYLIVPAAADVDPTVGGTRSPVVPANLLFVRAATRTTPVNAIVDGLTLIDGDRIALLDANDRPRDIVEWDTPTATYKPVGIPSLADWLLIVLQGTAFARAVWWREDGNVAGVPWRMRLGALRTHTPNVTVTQFTVDLGTERTAFPVSAAIVILSRPTNGLYAPTPSASACNVFTHTGWTYSVFTADGTDRVALDGLTDGLLGPLIRSGPHCGRVCPPSLRRDD